MTLLELSKTGNDVTPSWFISSSASDKGLSPLKMLVSQELALSTTMDGLLDREDTL